MTDSERPREDWLSQFDGTRLAERLEVSAILATVDADGAPHLSFLGVGEILARAPDRLSLLLWPRSTTAANIERTGRGTLFLTVDGSVWEARLGARAVDDGQDGPRRFDAEIVSTRCHAAPYAEVTGMIGFHLHDPAATVERWARQIERLATPAP